MFDQHSMAQDTGATRDLGKEIIFNFLGDGQLELFRHDFLQDQLVLHGSKEASLARAEKNKVN